MWCAIVVAVMVATVQCQSIECQNGGFQVNSTTCNCPTLFNDGGNCTVKQCLNDGYLDDTSSFEPICICPPGYNGLSCDAVNAYRPSPGAFPVKKTLNLVIANFLTDNYGENALTVLKNVLNISNKILDLKYFDDIHFKQITVNGSWIKIKSNSATAYDFDFSNVHDYDVKSELSQFVSDVSNVKFNKTQTYQCYSIPGFYEDLLDFVKKKRLMRTFVTIFTQHPPVYTEHEWQALVTFCNVFQIKINILWGYDKTFLRCDYSSPDITQFWEMVTETHGHIIGVGPSYKEMKTPDVAQSPVQTLLSLHGNYELVQQEAYTIFSENPEFTLNGDTGTNDYVLIFQTKKPNHALQVLETSGTAGLSQPMLAKTGDAVMYTVSNLPTIPGIPLLQFSVNSSMSGQTDDVIARAYIKGGSSMLRVYTSFIESKNLDSSVPIPVFGNPLYLSLHAEGIVSPQIQNISLVNRAIVKDQHNGLIYFDPRRDTTFEFVTSVPSINFEMSSDMSRKIFWKELTFTTTNDQTFKRVLSFLVRRNSINTSIKKQTTGTTTTTATTTKDTPSITSTRLESCRANLKDATTLTLGYSNSVPDNLLSSIVLQIKTTKFSNYGLVMWDRTGNPGDKAITPQFFDTFSEAESAVYNIFKKNPAYVPNVLWTTDVIDKIMALVSSKNISENALLVMVVADEPPMKAFDEFKKTDDYKKIITQSFRFMFISSFADISSKKNLGPNFYNLLSGTTQGHFIAVAPEDYNGEKNLDDTVAYQIYSDLLSKIGNKPLILSVDVTESSPTSSSFIDLTNATEDLSLFVTLSYDVLAGDIANSVSFMELIGHHANGSYIALNAERYGNTNFYSANVTLKAGFNYMVEPSYVMKSSYVMKPRPIHIRYWGTKNVVFSVTFNDLTENAKLELGPNTYDGMAARVAVKSVGSTIDVHVTRCDGSTTLFYGRYQTAIIQSSTDCQNASFYPYFCTIDNTTCPSGYDGLHYAKFRVFNETRNISYFTRPFLCDSKAPVTPNQLCKEKDENGNIFCSASKSPDGPYYRGPTGQVFDCSGNGELHYTPERNRTLGFRSNYVCQCATGFIGVSCQSAICESSKNSVPGALDTNYRSFSVVVGQSTTYNGIAAGFNLFNTVKNLLPINRIDGVWLYQLYIQYSNGKVFPLYVGPSWIAFRASVENSELLSLDPGNETQSNYINLGDSFRTIIAPLGQQQRGLAFFYYHSDGDIKFRVNDGITRTVDDFYGLSQRYKQQIMLLTRVMTCSMTKDSPVLLNEQNEDLMQAVRSTGGMWIEYNDTLMNDTHPFDSFKEIVMDVLTSGKPISLNAHNQLVGESLTFSIEQSIDKAVFVLSCNHRNPGKLWLGDCNGGTEENINSNFYGYIPIKKGFYCYKTNNICVVTVFSSGGIAPATEFVKKWNNDAPSAYATTSTSHGPSLAVSIADSWSNDDKSSRRAHREKCTFEYATYSMKKLNISQIGYNSFKLNVNDSNTVISKYIPYVATATIDCQNEGVFDPDTGSCINCPDGFSGADCSVITCDNGIQNVWGSACNCYKKGMRACNNDNPV